jgi:hypothetical protein
MLDETSSISRFFTIGLVWALQVSTMMPVQHVVQCVHQLGLEYLFYNIILQHPAALFSWCQLLFYSLTCNTNVP